MDNGRSTGGSELSVEQQRIFELLSQETRHLIVQFILGHPEHLMSLTELDYMIPKSRTTISEQFNALVEAGILDLYCHESSETGQDLPSEFYGPTERGIEILYEFKYLRGVPVVRALYDNTEKSAEVKRHENAPRPDLPEAVAAALSMDEDPEEMEENAEN